MKERKKHMGSDASHGTLRNARRRVATQPKRKRKRKRGTLLPYPALPCGRELQRDCAADAAGGAHHQRNAHFLGHLCVVLCSALLCVRSRGCAVEPRLPAVSCRAAQCPAVPLSWPLRLDDRSIDRC